MEGELLDGLGLHLNSLSNPDELISCCELECGGLVLVEGSDPDGAEPSVVPVGVVWNKESVHLQLVVADQVEGGVVYALEVVAEQVSPRQSDGKVWIRTKAHLGPVVCKERQKYKIPSQCCNTTPKISKSYKAWKLHHKHCKELQHSQQSPEVELS